MSKTFNERVALRIREILPTNSEFTIEADPASWPGYILVTHSSGVHTNTKPWASDESASVAEDVVQETLRSIAYQLLPKHYFTPWQQDRCKEAHKSWVEQTGIKL